MSTVLNQYRVLQQADWGGRVVCQAESRESGQTCWLIAEPANLLASLEGQPSLPPVQQIGVEGDVRWLVGVPLQGQTLAVLRESGTLTAEQGVAALNRVLDALEGLASLSSGLVPGYLDPECIVQDGAGTWWLDCYRLALVPEARRFAGLPAGIKPFGKLFTWLITGSAVSTMTPPTGISAALKSFIGRCLSYSFSSLGEMRMAFHQVRGEPLPMLAKRRVAPPLRGRAAPERPAETPSAPADRRLRMVALAGGLLLVTALGGAAALALRSAPTQVQATLPEPRPGQAGPAGPTTASAVPAKPLVVGPDTRLEERRGLLVEQGELRRLSQTQSAVASSTPPVRSVRTGPGTPPPRLPAVVPGSIEDMDSAAGGKAVAVSLNGQWVGYAYAYGGNGYAISLDAYNKLLVQHLRWNQLPDGGFRLWNHQVNIVTADVTLIQDRLWLRLTPRLLSGVGVRLAGTSGGLHFTTR